MHPVNQAARLRVACRFSKCSFGAISFNLLTSAGGFVDVAQYLRLALDFLRIAKVKSGTFNAKLPLTASAARAMTAQSDRSIDVEGAENDFVIHVARIWFRISASCASILVKVFPSSVLYAHQFFELLRLTS